MITKLSLTLAGYFAKKSVYDAEEINVYSYGFELLLSTVFNMVGIIVIALLMNELIGAILFCVAFVPLRLSAGGYHAKHHWSCILGFNMIFLAFAIINHYLNIEYMLPYSLVSAMISAILVWSLSPIEAVNKPLKPEQRKQQRNRSIILICVVLAVTLLFYAVDFDEKYFPLLSFFNSGALAASLSLVVATIVNKNNSIDVDSTI